MKLGHKLILCFLGFGLVPLIVAAIVSISTTDGLSRESAEVMQSAATATMDKIERNLFERYGDVQAFGLNEGVKDPKTWYDKSSKNHITGIMNSYMKNYSPIYDLMMMVDLNGRVIATSTVNAEGKPIKNSFLYEKDFSQAKWFKNAKSGTFLKGENISGTWVDDAAFDEDVKEALGNDGLVISFAAPVFDSNGKVIAIWRNLASMSLVESILQDTYAGLAEQNLKAASIVLLTQSGKLIENYVPLKNGPKVVFEPKITLKEDWSDRNPAVKAVMNGKTEVLFTPKNSLEPELVQGIFKSKGALGYPGLGWSAIVREEQTTFFTERDGILRTFILMFLVVTGVLLALAIFISRQITRPVLAMSRSLGIVASGSLDTEVEYQGKDEIGGLASDLRTLLERLRFNSSWASKIAEGDLRPQNVNQKDLDAMGLALHKISQSLVESLSSIRTTSSRVSSVANELRDASSSLAESAQHAAHKSEVIQNSAVETARASQEVAQLSEQQAYSLSNVVEQMSQVSVVIQGVVEKVSIVKEASDAATHTAMQSSTSVESAINGMGVIHESTEQVADHLSELNTRSEEIGGIVSLIADIAGQTNLLALNAAIEAARAGEHGRGFAVVAEEVRKLAERCAEATNDISNLVGEIRSLVEKSSNSMSKANDAVLNGQKLSEEVQESLSKILETVSALTEPVDQVATIAQEVSQLSTDVQGSVAQVAVATEQNAAAAQEMAASSEGVSEAISEVSAVNEEQTALTEELTAQASELARSAEEMDEQIGRFQMEDSAQSVLKVAA